ncbi:MAG: ABC transporter substrate-binding protein [Tissierella sp.]|uniref:ABC transporter substrate-binding protein n=1 Tax=Tissierella sp. TaxID=41274 RepID=UPI003F95C7F4
MKLKNVKRFSFILTLILLLTVVVACSQKDTTEPDKEEETPVTENTEFPKTIEDGFENEIELENKPEKIVSLAPNNTEILFALGLGDNVVGVTSFCDYPEEALEKEKIGDYEGMNLEKIIELDPDIVLSYGEMDENEANRLKEANIKIISYMPESIDEIVETIKAIGNATGSEEKAKEITDEMMSHRDNIIEKVKDTEEKKVFYEVWHDPLQAAGPGSFMDELITLSNGENIAGDADKAYAEYDLETLVEKDPEIYIAPDDNPDVSKETIAERPGYSDLTAIKEESIYLVDGNLASRAGPRIVEALEMIAKTIHPDSFK